MRKKRFRKKQYQGLINELCPHNCRKKDCFLKDVLFDLHPNPRLLTQIKCIHRFKKALAKERKVDAKGITSSQALEEWINRGYAENFAENYNENKMFTQIYKETVINN